MMKRRHTTAAKPLQGLPSEVRFMEHEPGVLVAQQFLGGKWWDVPTIRSSGVQSPSEIPKAPETRPAVTQGSGGTKCHPEKCGYGRAMLAPAGYGNLLLPLIATNLLWFGVFVYGTSVIAREFIALQATVLQIAGQLAEARQTEGSR